MRDGAPDGNLGDGIQNRDQNFEIFHSDRHRRGKLTCDLERHFQGVLASRNFCPSGRALELIPDFCKVDAFKHDEYVRNAIGCISDVQRSALAFWWKAGRHVFTQYLIGLMRPASSDEVSLGNPS
jgi:hypothetical protein